MGSLVAPLDELWAVAGRQTPILHADELLLMNTLPNVVLLLPEAAI